MSTATVDPAKVRAWAREHGFAVGERGRLSFALITCYLADQQFATVDDG